MEQKHTQKPWIVDGLWIVGGIPEEPIAVCKLMKNAGQPVLANGNLIAAAPDLLAACRGMINAHELGLWKTTNGSDNDVLDGLKRTIAKTS